MSHILLVVNRKTTADSLLELFGRHEHSLSVATTQRAVLQMIRHNAPDLVIVDTTSARRGGTPLAEAIRRQSDVPIILIVRSAPASQTIEDTAWILKPFSSQELLQRATTLMDRVNTITVGELVLNIRTRQLFRPSREPLTLTPKQFSLLRTFMRHVGQTLSRVDIMRDVWQTDFVDDTRTLNVHIRWLRECIEDDPTNPHYLKTVRGVGYLFEVPER